MSSLVIRPFEQGDLDAAAGLLADRHRRHRLAEPLLDPAFEQAPAARRRQRGSWKPEMTAFIPS